MPRRSGGSFGGGRSGGGLFGRRTTTPARRTPSASAPARRPAAAPPATMGGGGGMLSGIGGAIMQGMAFGGGSAIAHRAVDAVVGPREMKVSHDNGEGAGAAPAAAGAAAAATPAPAAVDCSSYMNTMNKCFTEHSSEVSYCQSDVDMFKACQAGEILQ